MGPIGRNLTSDSAHRDWWQGTIWRTNLYSTFSMLKILWSLRPRVLSLVRYSPISLVSHHLALFPFNHGTMRLSRLMEYESCMTQFNPELPTAYWYDTWYDSEDMRWRTLLMLNILDAPITYYIIPCSYWQREESGWRAVSNYSAVF